MVSLVGVASLIPNEVQLRSRFKVHTIAHVGGEVAVMLEEKLVALSSKESLDGDDAFDILKLLQDHTTPILSLRGVGSSPAATSGRHHGSKLMKTCGLATGRKSTGVESNRDEKGSVNREGEGRRSGEGKSTAELENGSLSVPSRRTLFGPRVESHCEPRSSSDGVLGAKAVLNFNSLEEFPTMQSAAAIQTRYIVACQKY